ncbi:MAG: SDR family NAD(P)-dependent oxidoreductase [Paracoccaceae bacterium]|nr:SDR family NAD(P)-dependent oxidoreductase [Paracoccaceae bacterium]MDE2912808.1 SDR family NAD(P)-dependent oxidoreductase [Paracoccaceae bacterium]
MGNRTILITGCSSGIGEDAALTLSRRGWRVFATCRSPDDCRRLAEGGLESLVLDYDNEASIESAVAEILERTGGTLDALFNNGAFATPGAVEDLPRAALRAIYETNVFGYFDLINRVLPAMRRQGHGRIVNCSSVFGFSAFPFRGAYVSTKFALEGLSDTLRLELRGTAIKVILIRPGPITTLIRQNARPHFESWIRWKESPHRHLYEQIFVPRLYADSLPRDFGERPPSSVTRKLIHALESPNPGSHYHVTAPTYIVAAFKRLLPTRTVDWLLSRR